MQRFTADRDQNTADEIWLLEHYPVFTQGRTGNPEYILMPGDIPVVQSDRGGNVTYHGPGQITGYLLVDLHRKHIGVRVLVESIETAIVETLAVYGVQAHSRSDAPGVYVQGAGKIGSIGIRVRHGCSYHGLNLNIDMDLEPWRRINPCGLGVPMTQLADLAASPLPDISEIADRLAARLVATLRYNACETGGEPDVLIAAAG